MDQEEKIKQLMEKDNASAFDIAVDRQIELDAANKRIKELEELKNEVLKVWNEDGENGEIQMKTPIAWYRVLRLAEKF